MTTHKIASNKLSCFITVGSRESGVSAKISCEECYEFMSVCRFIVP